MIKLTQDTRPDDVIDFEKPESLGDVRAWSYSALKVFEECPYRTYISRVKGVKEPSGPAADRGTQIHQEAEDYVNGTLGELPDSCKKFQDEFEELRSLYIDAKVELEGEWGFDLDWAPVGWMQKETWARIKLDALVQEDDTSARVIDYKTGKHFGNEIAHGQQGLLYAIGTFFRYPHLQFVQTEFWYLDHAKTTTKQYTREQAMVFAPGYHRRAVKMTTETEFAPTPSKNSCRWCSFRKGDEPECVWGVD
jgi:CRISPR/Cas system-associated exonuclease Cas4 (RecB family)